MKLDERSRAIEAIAKMSEIYIERVRSIVDEPLSQEKSEELQALGRRIRWMQQGLESGYYDNLS